LNQKYQLNLPESEEYETLNGLIVYYHQNIPVVKENITISGFRFLILEVNKTRIEKVELLRLT
jgi:CBS domain containing-hemolysin-like protein